MSETPISEASGGTAGEAARAVPIRIGLLDRWRSAYLAGRWDRVLIAVLIAEFAFVMRVVALGSIPAEMWGDVIQHHLLASEILSGQFFLDYRFGGDGPMFSYLAAGVTSIFGLSFLTLKLTSVLIGTAVVVATYYLADELFPATSVPAVSGFIAAVSFWGITFSRQAKPYILVPLFVALTVIFALKKRPILAGIMLGLGMYTQAAFWGMPIVCFLAYPAVFLIGLVIATPLIRDFLQNPDNYFGSGSYLGDKVGGGTQLSPLNLVGRLLDNIWRNALSFNVRGDITFRHNIVGHPHLDWLSGLFFLLGMVLLVRLVVVNRDWRLARWFLLPFAVVQAPSLMDVHPQNVPAMGRMLGIVPFVFIAVAYGVVWTAQQVQQRWPRYSPRLPLLGAALALILAFNAYNYFVVYPKGLPNGNTPFGRIISQDFDRYAPSTEFALLGCCWGQWGQPEPEAIQFVVELPRSVVHLDDATIFQMELQRMAAMLPSGRQLVVAMDPRLRDLYPLPRMLHHRHGYLLWKNGWDVAWIEVGRR